jgi:Zn finger protein HypA/HybF involved in hydrogenase expression
VYKGEYNRNKQKLLFRCDCGNEYYETWNHILSSNRLCCPSCARAISKINGSRKLHTADIKAECQKQGVELIYFHGNAKDVHYKDSDGYK